MEKDNSLNKYRLLIDDHLTIRQGGHFFLQTKRNVKLREQEVFRLIGKGVGNAEIADRLNANNGTIGTYVTRIIKKLNLNNRRALRKYTVEYVHIVNIVIDSMFIAIMFSI